MKLLLVLCFVGVCWAQDTRVRHLHIISEIQARFAITDILSLVENEGRYPREVTFTARLPEEAFISNYSMKIDGLNVVGEVKEKDQAKADYEREKKKGKSTALVAQLPRETNAFEITVHVAPRSEVEFNLTYQEVLKRVHGVYKHIINIQPDQVVEDIQVDVLIAENGKISQVYVPKFHKNAGQMTNRELLNQPEDQEVVVRTSEERYSSLAYIYFAPDVSSNRPVDGQLVVLYDVERGFNGGEIEVLDGYFVHFVAPTDLNDANKHVVFVIDKSGSMKGRKFEETKSAMYTILDDLHSRDYFNILMFSNKVQSWKSKSQRADSYRKDEAKKWIDGIQAGGGTNVYQAMSDAIELIKDDRNRKFASMVVFLTDGKATVGEKNSQVIMDKIASENSRVKAHIHGLAFGNDADYELLQDITNENGGIARRIYHDSDADLQLDGFYQEISTPVLKDVTIKYLKGSVDISSLIRSEDDLFYDGGEFMVVGQVNPDWDQNNLVSQVKGKQASSRRPVRLSAISRSLDAPPTCFPQPQTVGGRPAPNPQHIPLCPMDDESTVTTPRPVVASNTLSGFIERMWAYMTIKKLLDTAKSRSSTSTEVDEALDRALDLSLKYNFVTELTSMVVIDPRDTNIESQLSQQDPLAGDSSKKRGPQDEELEPSPAIKTLVGEPKPSAKSKESSKGTSCDPDVVLMIDVGDGSRSFNFFASRTGRQLASRLARDSKLDQRLAIAQLSDDRDVTVYQKFGDKHDDSLLMSASGSSGPGGDLKKLKDMLAAESGKRKILVLFTGKDSLDSFKSVIEELEKNDVQVIAASVFTPFSSEKVKELEDAIDSSNIIDGASASAIAKLIKTGTC